MSEQQIPEQIPEQIPLPDSGDPTKSVDNPYNSRNHEQQSLNKSDVLAVAGLMGQVAGSLNEIDKMNAGGHNSFIRAKKIDPRQALNNFVGANSSAGIQPVPQQVSQPVPQQVSQPVPQPISQPVQQIQQPIVNQGDSGLEQRVRELEKIVNSYKKITKFKRGISYNVNTNKITGEYKDPGDILDIVASSLANQTKTITIKLNDSNKNR